MATIYSQEIDRTVDPFKSKICKACGLFLNQAPIFDKQKKSNIFWVGLSAVQFNDDEEKLPLSPFTRSGALIERIEKPFIQDISFYKTNLVKCLPLKNDKIRYPLEHEMEKCFPNFEYEMRKLKPSIVFLLGKQVGSFVFKRFLQKDLSLDENFNYSSISVNNIIFIPIHHPSYILVYKRKYVEDYMRNIQLLFEKSLVT